MIIVLRPDATEVDVSHIVEKAAKLGLKANVSRGTERTIIGLIGPEEKLQSSLWRCSPGVEKVMPVLEPYKLVSREIIERRLRSIHDQPGV